MSKKLSGEQQSYQKANEELQVENQDIASDDMKEVYKEQNNQLKGFLQYVVTIYAAYEITDKGSLILNQAQKKKLKLEVKDKLTTLGYALGDKEEQVVTNILTNVAENSYNKTNFLLDIGVSFDLPIGGLSEDEIKSVINKQLKNKSFSTRIWDNQNTLINQLQKEVNSVISNGKDVRKASKAIKERFNVNAYNSKRLVENEVKNVQTKMQKKIYKDSDVVDKMMWSATLDSKTRDKHEDYDGELFDANNPSDSMENYVLCRCSWVPVVDGWKPKIRYCQEDGKTIDYKTYKEWAKTRDIE